MLPKRFTVFPGEEPGVEITMIEISKGRYWDLPWSCNRLCLAPCVPSFSVRIWDIMFFGMTIKAERFSVRYLVTKLGEFREFIDMVSMKISALRVSATDAGIIVALKNDRSPFSVCGNIPGYLHFWRNSALPVGIARSVKFSLGYAKGPKERLLIVAKRYPFSPFVVSAPLCKRFSHGLGNIRRFLFRNAYAVVALHVESVISGFIGGKEIARFPLFALLTALLCLAKQQIFINGKAELPCPSPENSHSLRCHCFHGLSQYYTGGDCYVN